MTLAYFFCCYSTLSSPSLFCFSSHVRCQADRGGQRERRLGTVVGAHTRIVSFVYDEETNQSALSLAKIYAASIWQLKKCMEKLSMRRT